MTRGPIYRILEFLTRALLLAFWNYRAEGTGNVPLKGGAILASTHQSVLDPVMVRAPLKRPLGYVARSTLFKRPVFARLIRGLGAVSFEREGTGAREMRGVLECLEGGGALLFFPEGTRSKDGKIGALKPGIALLARRAEVPVVPVAVDGTHICWPRSQRLFRPGRVRVVFGEPVRYDRRTKRTEVLEDLRNRLVALRDRAVSMA